MSTGSDHVVVPFAVFVERRERRSRIAVALREAPQQRDPDEFGRVTAAEPPPAFHGTRAEPNRPVKSDCP